MSQFQTIPQALLRKALFQQPSGVTTVLREGMAVCLETGNTGQDIENIVSRPDIASVKRAPFIVTKASAGVSAESMIEVARVLDRENPRINVWTDQSITANDILGLQPNSYVFRRGALFHSWGLRALETVDRSTTAGVVACELIPHLSALDILNSMHWWMDDFKNFTTAHDGWVAIAASGSAAGTSVGGGRLVLTPQATTDNASALIHGQLVNGSFFPSTSGQACYFEAVIVPTEHNTDDMNIFAGFLDAAQTVAATLPILDDASLVAADFMAFNKVENATSWTGKSYGASALGTASGGTTAAFATATTYRLQALHDGKGSVLFWVNGVFIGSVSTSTALPVAAMVPCIQVKAGSNTGTPSLAVHHFAGAHVKGSAAIS